MYIVFQEIHFLPDTLLLSIVKLVYIIDIAAFATDAAKLLFVGPQEIGDKKEEAHEILVDAWIGVVIPIVMFQCILQEQIAPLVLDLVLKNRTERRMIIFQEADE